MTESPRHRLAWLHPAVVVIFFAFLAMRSWRSWGDPVVDFPHELYMPWRISQGDVLYRQVQNVYGPFSQYFNAGLFSIFGPSYLTLTATNLVLTLGFALLIQSVLKRALGKWTGTIAALSFLCLHAFEQLGITSSYTFIAPYAHESTHGVILVFLVITLGTAKPSRARFFSQGLIWGFCALTKPEIVLACSVALLAQFRHPLLARFRPLALGALIAPLASILYFRFHGGFDFAAATEISFRSLNPSYTLSQAMNSIYREGTGMGDLGGNLARMLQAVLFVTREPLELSRLWPPLCLAGTLWVFFKRKSIPEEKLRLLLPLGAAATVLTLKIGLNAHFYWFGFYLLPLATVFLVGWIPTASRNKTIRVALAFVLALLCLRVTTRSIAAYDEKTLPLGDGADRFYVRPSGVYATGQSPFASGALVHEVLEHLKQRISPGSTLMAIPEGLIFNDLLKLKNSTPFIANFVTQTLYDAWGGESAILAGLLASPPDYALFLHRAPEFATNYEIGGPHGYARVVLDWIEANYDEIDRIGPKSDDFAQLGYALFKKKSANSSPVSP